MLAPMPGANPGFSETGSYVFDLPSGEGWTWRVDDEPLAVRNRACEWRPGFYAGEVTAELIRDGSTAGVFLLGVAPDDRKVGADAFRLMLRELWEFDPRLVVGTEPSRSATGVLGRSEDPHVAFARLRRYGHEFLRALSTATATPRSALRSVREWTPLHHVRTVDRHTARVAARGTSIALFGEGESGMGIFNPAMRLDVPRVEETRDSAANRTLLYMVRAVLQRVRYVRQRLEIEVRKEERRGDQSGTRTPLSARWSVRREWLIDLDARLARILRRPPFPEVRRAELSAAGLNAVAADPLYAHAWGRGWRALRTGLEGDLSDERLWISPSWEVYERWSFMTLGRLLEREWPAWNWRRDRHGWIGTRGGREAVLREQVRFRSRTTPFERPWSVSRLRIPDILLRVTAPDGERFVVLDTKYRASRQNVLDAMASAHIYQDSLRIGERRPEASLLMVPAIEGAAWLAAPGFHSTHRVGIHEMTPGRPARLPEAISSVLVT